jgi:DNA-binding CsgD family transcriptional regulator
MAQPTDAGVGPAAYRPGGDEAAEQPSRQAVLVLTPALRLLHMNEEAATIAQGLNETRRGRCATGLLPREIIELCHALCRMLTAPTDRPVREAQIRRHVEGHPDGPIVLRGLGLLDSGDLSQARLLVFMDRLNVPDDFGVAQGGRLFHLTHREQMVLRHLAQGLTNKEIARTLHIAEQTVKTHVKGLMQKMQATTRTGLLSRLVAASRPRPAGPPSYSPAS